MNLVLVNHMNHRQKVSLLLKASQDSHCQMPGNMPETLADVMPAWPCPLLSPSPRVYENNSLLLGSIAVLKISITDSSFQLALSVLNSVIMK